MTALDDALQAMESGQKQSFILPMHTQAMTDFCEALRAASKGGDAECSRLGSRIGSITRLYCPARFTAAFCVGGDDQR